MGFFESIAGTISSFFQVGGPNGPRWKNNAGALEARDSADATFAIVRAADPVNANDAVTLESLATINPATSTIPWPTMQFHKVRWLNGDTATNAGNAPTAGQQYAGWSTLTFNNVTTTPAAATTSRLAATKRLRFQSAAATAYVGVFESGYINAGVTQFGVWRGNGANRGGFLFRTRFAISNIGASSTIHAFIGFIEAAGQAAAGTDYTTLATTSLLGIGFTATTSAGSAFPAANWQAIESAHNAPHLTDLGAGFALTVNDFIEMILYAAPNDTKATLTMNNLTTGATTTVTLNTNLPTNTIFMAMQVSFGVQTIAAGTDALDVSMIYQETFDA
jgi:hypothetical protein